jgi:hypothetical protein
MIRTYYCPNCRATIYCSDRFCGNCGVSLKWVEVQMPTADSGDSHQKSVDGQNVHWQHQDRYYQKQQKKTVQYSHAHRTHKPVSTSPKKQTTNNNSRQTAVLDKNKPADDNTELLKNEVAKLLENFLDEAE